MVGFVIWLLVCFGVGLAGRSVYGICEVVSGVGFWAFGKFLWIVFRLAGLGCLVATGFGVLLRLLVYGNF